MYVKRVPARRTSSTQKESCFEALPHFPGFFGFCGIGSGITASSLCTANGGNTPRDPAHNPREIRGVHQIRRTWCRSATRRRFVYATKRKYRASADAGGREASSACSASAPNRRCPRREGYASPQVAFQDHTAGVPFHSTPSRRHSSRQRENPPAAAD